MIHSTRFVSSCLEQVDSIMAHAAVYAVGMVICTHSLLKTFKQRTGMALWKLFRVE